MGNGTLRLLLIAGAQGGDTTISNDTLPYLVRQARYVYPSVPARYCVIVPSAPWAIVLQVKVRT